MDFLGGSIGKGEDKEEIIKSLQRIQMSEAEKLYLNKIETSTEHSDFKGLLDKYMDRN